MAKHKQEYKASTKVSQYPRYKEVIDIKVNCVFCKMRLYVPDTSIDAVLASLKLVGRAIMVCYVCGQAQLVSWKMSQSQYR